MSLKDVAAERYGEDRARLLREEQRMTVPTEVRTRWAHDWMLAELAEAHYRARRSPRYVDRLAWKARYVRALRAANQLARELGVWPLRPDQRVVIVDRDHYCNDLGLLVRADRDYEEVVPVGTLGVVVGVYRGLPDDEVWLWEVYFPAVRKRLVVLAGMLADEESAARASEG